MAEQDVKDKFIAMVSAKAAVTLPISDFIPRAMLHSVVHEIANRDSP